MSIAYWCVLVAAILPYVTVGVAKARSAYDNSNPRADIHRGVALRAHGAHQNGFEAFAFFAVAVLVASGCSSKPAIPLLDGLALSWVAARLGYIAAYLAGRPTLRSFVWSVGLVIAIAIFTMPAWRG